MRKWIGVVGLFGLLALSACVTINVYFPAAEAQEAAREFVDQVIGNTQQSEEGTEVKDDSSGLQGGMAAVLSFFVSSAQAQTPDLDLRTPAIQTIRERMVERFRNELKPHVESGALGFDNQGMIVVRDAAALGLKDRATVNRAVADDNRDRKALYREIAVANGHPEWEDRIRQTFTQQWGARARAGWWIQDAGGNWKQR